MICLIFVEIFIVVYASGDIDVVDVNYISYHEMLENGKESIVRQIMQN